MYPESINNTKDKIKKKDAKRVLKNWIRKKYKVLLIQIDKEKSSYILLRNWKFDWHEKDNADKEEINKYSEDIDITDYWKIIPREWEVNEISFKAYSSPGFHIKTKPTCKQIEENGYKWNNMEKSVREFYFNCEVSQQINQKPKKKVAVYHIPSSRPKERFVIDAVYLSDYIANEDRYLITMIDHFSKYGWTKLVKNKSAD